MPKPDRFQFLGRADDIQIVGDESGFELHFSTARGDYVVNVHGVASDLHAEVNREIGAWIAEAAEAWSMRPVTDDEMSVRVSRLSDLWDARSEK